VAATGMEQVIEGVQLVPRPRGLLVDVAQNLDLAGDRWRGGVKFPSLGCSGIGRIPLEFCADENITQTEPTRGVVTFQAFSVVANESCSANDIDEAWLYERLNERMNAMASEQIAAELMSGTVTGTSPSLRDSPTVVTTTPSDAKTVMARVEKGLAAKLHNAQGIIHMPVESLMWGDVTGAVLVAGDRLETKSGNLVAADAGYLGDPPTGTAANAATRWIYGSGPVALQLGPPRNLRMQFPDMSRNIVTGRVIAEAVVAFDPCAVVAAEFTIPT
jgi:hypothetical protein